MTKLERLEKEIFNTVYMWGRAIKVNHKAPTYKKLMQEYRKLVIESIDWQKVQAVMDEYAGKVDDDSTYFVKPETKRKYRNQIKEIILNTNAKK